MRLVAICVLACVACKHDNRREPIGDRIEPPAGLRLGMTAAEAKAAMPELGEGFGGAGSAGGESPGAFLAGDAQLVANLSRGKIAQIYIAWDGSKVSSDEVEQLLVEHWHAPEIVKGPFGPVKEWKTTGPGWRARLLVDEMAPRVELAPYRPLTPAFFGPKVAPPGPLAKLKPGMTYAEAKAAVPDLPPQSSILVVDVGADDVEGLVQFGDDQRIGAMVIELPSVDDTKKLAESAWKAGTTTDSGVTWSGDGWRAVLTRQIAEGSEGRHEYARIEFAPL